MNSLKILEEAAVPLVEEMISLELEREGTSFEELLKEDSEKVLPKKEKKNPSGIFDVLHQNTPLTTPLPSLSGQEVSLIGPLKIPQEVELLFEKMGLITHELFQSGDTHTTITLGNDFASDLFRGAEIIIHEFSTAPKSYNIQINACAEALTLLQGQTSAFMQYIEQKKAPFTIFRMDTSLKQENRGKYRVANISDSNDPQLSG